jgi:DNA polymerase III epsilon subunit-like protein
MYGIDAKPELERFVGLVDHARKRGIRIVAHQAMFDVNAVNRTLARFNSLKRIEQHHVFCTMKASRPLLRLHDVRGRVRNPKNSELYTFLVKDPLPLNLHDALTDCIITARSFLAGVQRRWWKFEL